MDWTVEESRRWNVGRELVRLLRRALARWWLVVLAAAVLTAVIVYRASRKPPVYKARLLIRITESTVAEGELVPPSELRDYLTAVAFSKRNLLALIHEHRLYPDELEISDEQAVEAMREDIDVGVSNNYFLEYRSDNAPPRSVRVYLSYAADDPDLAFSVVNDLGNTLIAAERETRREISRVAASAASRASETVKEIIDARQVELTAKGNALAERRGDPSLLEIEIGKLEAEIGALEAQLQRLEADERRLALRRALEEEELGLRFDIVNATRPPTIVRSLERTLFVALVVFIVLLPLCVVTVGAFDTRVRDEGDVKRLKIEILGHVPAFDGCDLGSLKSRRPPRGGKRTPVG